MEKVDGGERSVQVDRSKAVDSGPEGALDKGGARGAATGTLVDVH